MVLLVDLHGYTVAQVVGLEHRITDEAPVGLTEAPHVLALHWSPHDPLAPLPVGRPEQRRVGLDLFNFGGKVLRDIAIEVLHDGGGQGNVASLAAFYGDVPESPSTVQVSDSQRSHRFSPHPRVTEDQKDCQVARTL